MGHLAHRLLRLSPRQTRFEARGFVPRDDAARDWLERPGEAFVAGFNGALLHGPCPALDDFLDDRPITHVGFAYEGAAMALALLDLLTPWRRNRVSRFLSGPAAAHNYMVAVGVGWARARLRRSVDPPPSTVDPLVDWLVVDGAGFHAGYFDTVACVDQQRPGPCRESNARAVWDQGLGRSLWFSRGADVRAIAQTIARFDSLRRADLWAGLGLAASYAGGADDRDLAALVEAAGTHRAALAQGAVFAAGARLRADTPAPWTDRACLALSGHDVTAADALAERIRAELPGDAPCAYQLWRKTLQRSLADDPAGVSA